MQLTFKSGAQIVVDVEEFTVGTDRYTDALTSLKWQTPAGAKAELNYLANLGAIDAIVTLK